MEPGKDMDAAVAAAALGQFLFCHVQDWLLCYPDLLPCTVPILGIEQLPTDTWFVLELGNPSPGKGVVLGGVKRVPDYSTSREAAEAALTKFAAMRDRCTWNAVRRNDNGIWTVELQASSAAQLANWWTGVGNSEPEALCRALLRASGCALQPNEIEKSTPGEHLRGDAL